MRALSARESEGCVKRLSVDDLRDGPSVEVGPNDRIRPGMPVFTALDGTLRRPMTVAELERAALLERAASEAAEPPDFVWPGKDSPPTDEQKAAHARVSALVTHELKRIDSALRQITGGLGVVGGITVHRPHDDDSQEDSRALLAHVEAGERVLRVEIRDADRLVWRGWWDRAGWSTVWREEWF